MPVESEQLVLSNGKFYFKNGRFTDPDHGEELWTSDGTPAGTRLFKEFVPGPESSYVDIHSIGNRLLLGVFDEQGAFEPWMSDGTEANTIRLADLTVSFVTGSSEPEVMGSIGARTVFRADDGVQGNEVWATDGTSAGTRILPITRRYGSCQWDRPFLMTATCCSAARVRPARSCGALMAPRRVRSSQGHRARIRQQRSAVVRTVVLNGVAYFVANDGVHGPEVWRSDGTSAGTWLVSDLSPGNEDRTRLLGSTTSDRLFIYINDDPPLLYSSDGTAAGTVLVSNSLFANFQGDFAFQNRVCFGTGVANDPISEIYCSTGAAGSAVRISDFHSAGVVVGSRVYVLNGQLLFPPSWREEGSRVVAFTSAMAPSPRPSGSVTSISIRRDAERGYAPRLLQARPYVLWRERYLGDRRHRGRYAQHAEGQQRLA